MIGRTISHYRIVSQLGEGGMGAVYLAQDFQLHRNVALKLLPPQLNTPEARRRLLREARAAGRLNHPNIMTIYEAGTSDDVDFIAMEHIAGMSLREKMKLGQLELSLTIDYILQVLAGLAKAHEEGIVHRDLKPSNIMINQDGLVKVVDFGLAANLAAEELSLVADKTKPGLLQGTVPYMSPEQARGEDLDPRSDLFSLSILFFEMLTGKNPFAGPSVVNVLYRINHDDPPPASSLQPELPVALDAILARGLAKKREDRWPSARSMAREISNAIAAGVSRTVFMPASSIGGNSSFPSAVLHESVERIPRYRSAFFGREKELKELSPMLREPGLVTLAAIGGEGKTRLACEASLANAAYFPDGVYVVELAEVGPEGVLSKISEVLLGDNPLARETAIADPLLQLQSFLRDRQLLLVIDNCEHVLSAVRHCLTQWMKTCRKPSFFATSREVLGIEGERIYRLRSLPSGLEGKPEESPAFLLFQSRAEASNQGVMSLPEQRNAAVEICQRLEGSPLAIELAASRVRALLPTQILERLGDAFKILRASSKMARHQSLEAAIQWSYDLLEPNERQLLSRLSVFLGGFQLNAAEALCDPDWDCFELIASLVDKSLLATDMFSGSIRYRLQEPIRQFLALRLTESGDAELFEKRHFQYCVDMAQNTVPKIDEYPDNSLLDRLGREHPNFLAAVERCVARKDFQGATQLMLALNRYWTETGRLGEGARVLRSIIDANQDRASTMALSALTVTYETMSGQAARASQLVPMLEQALAIPLPPLVGARLRFSLGFFNMEFGRAEKQLELWSEAANLARSVDPVFARQIHWSTAHVAIVNGRFEEGEQHLERALDLPIPTEGWFQFMHPQTAAVAEILRCGEGDVHEEALDVLRTALNGIEQLKLSLRMALVCSSSSLAFFHAGHYEEAEFWWWRGLEVAKSMSGFAMCRTLLEFVSWSVLLSGDRNRAGRIIGCIQSAIPAGGTLFRYLRPPSFPSFEDLFRDGDEAYRQSVTQGSKIPLTRMVDEVLAAVSVDIKTRSINRETLRSV